MKPYPKYKDSGIEWIGKVPEYWKVKKIKHSTYVKGRVGWHGLNSNDFIDAGPFLVTGTDFSNGKINWGTCYHVSMVNYKKDPYIQLAENDLLITKDGSIGKVVIVKGLEGQATLNSGVFVTRPLNDQYITTYLYWMLNSSVFSCFIDYNKTGSTVLHLYQDTFEDFSFPIPSIQEQKTVCYYLDRKTTQIDNLISKKQKLIELLKEERAAIINQAVTKGLNPDAPMKDSGIEWLGEIPEKWEVKRLKFVSDFKSGNGITANLIKNDGEYAVYGGNGLRGYTSSYTHEGSYVLIGRQGALCGNINYADGKFWASEHAVVATLVSDYNLFWFGELLRTMNLNQYSQSAAQPGLSVDHIKNLFIPVPSPNEQDVIAAYLDGKTTKIDQTSSKIEDQIEVLKEFRTALISEVVTGKIDVRDEELK